MKRGEGTFVAEKPPSVPRGEREKELEGGAMRYASLAVTIGAAPNEAVEQVKRQLKIFLERKEIGGRRNRRSALASRARATAVLSVRDSSYATAATRNPLSKKSLSPFRGSVYALLGRNGAGKSSLVRCLLGQQKPTAGGCFLFGEDVWKRRARLMAKVGVVPEDPDAPPSMTARQLSAFCARIYPTWDAPAVEARLARFGVPAGTPYGNLSKGQRALVALALALASSPELLVLDDPTLGLDAVARRAFFEELVGELADRGTTVLLTSHDLAGVESMATRVGILKGGRLVLDEDLEALKARFRRLRYANEATEDPPSTARSFRTSTP